MSRKPVDMGCVRVLHAARWGNGRIAAAVGCHEATVVRKLGEMGLKPHPQPPKARSESQKAAEERYQARPLPKGEAREARGKQDPLTFATLNVPGFNRDAMTLNGRTIRLDTLMRLANSVCKAEGREQCLNNPAWGV